MHQAYLQPPEKKAYAGEGIRKIHKALAEDNISYLLWALNRYAKAALAEIGDNSELDDALHACLAIAPALSEINNTLENAYRAIDELVMGGEDEGY